MKILAYTICFVAFFIAEARAADKMNVLFIMADDLRCELGCYGSAIAKTPNLDRLAASGVRFDHAYCQFPLCNPSRSSMLTGRTPADTGVLGNRTWFGDAHPDFMSLPKYFKANGYFTAHAGKIFHGGIDDTDAWSEGGQVRTLAGQPASAQANTGAGNTSTNTGNGETYVDDTLPAGERAGLAKDQYSDRWVVLEGMGETHGDSRAADRTIKYLREHKNDAFFIGFGTVKPHSPPQRRRDFTTNGRLTRSRCRQILPRVPRFRPASQRARFAQNADLFINRDATPAEARQMIRAYLAASAFADWNVGRVLAALDELGLREKTIIVFCVDHGYQLGEKGKWSKAGSLWEQSARIPFFICDPRAKGNGKPCERIVQMIDLYPTLVELCGLEQPAGLDGRSLVPLLDDPSAPWDHPAYTIWSEDGRHFTGVMVRTRALEICRILRPRRRSDAYRS